ncbi:MAG: glutathione S-transferase family protein [Bdellovibrionota bacterium]
MNNDELIFYTNPQSRSRIVRWMLEEMGVDYKVEVIGYGEPMKSEPYISINPMGKVPSVVHNGKIVTECAAICAYLADAFPEVGLAPMITDRASYYRWLFFAAGPLESAITNRNLGFEVPNDKQRMAGYGSYDLAINTLAKAVSEASYIAGDVFTAADVYVGSHVGWGLQFKTLPERKEFIEYFEKLNQRPAYIRATKLDDGLADAING